MDAGYQTKRTDTARGMASQLLAKPIVREYINAAKREIKASYTLDRGVLLERMMQIAMGEAEEEQVVVVMNGDYTSSPKIVKKKVSMKEQLKAAETLLTIVDVDRQSTTPVETTDSKILSALRTRKVQGDEPEAPQEESNDADE
jgi:phage terminase small subunit